MSVKKDNPNATKSLPCLQWQFLDGGEGREDLVESVELQRETLRTQVLEPEAEEPLFHPWVLQEYLRDLPRVDGTHEIVRRGTSFFFQFLDTLWTEGRK